MTETTTEGIRRCIGSAKFGIEPHEAAVEDFPKQPSQKDGLGRMCRTHWNQYTTALRNAAEARKAAEGEAPGVAAEEPDAADSEDAAAEATETKPKRRNRRPQRDAGAEVGQEGASG